LFELKSSFIPFSKGNFLWDFNPSLEKHALSKVEGRGREIFRISG
jgi:hypothetical protein